MILRDTQWLTSHHKMAGRLQTGIIDDYKVLSDRGYIIIDHMALQPA